MSKRFMMSKYLTVCNFRAAHQILDIWWMNSIYVKEKWRTYNIYYPAFHVVFFISIVFGVNQ